MNTNRRKFITASLTGGLAATLPVSTFASTPATKDIDTDSAYEKLDEILKKEVLKKELFTSPIIIETLELLRFKDSFCAMSDRRMVQNAGLLRTTD